MNNNQGSGVARARNSAESAHTRVAAWSAEIAANGAGDPGPQSPVMELLRSFHDVRLASECMKRLALILEQSDDLDAACELDAAVSGDPELNGLDGIVSEVGGYFGGLPEGDIQPSREGRNTCEVTRGEEPHLLQYNEIGAALLPRSLPA